jgi:hypothetical protein
MACAEGGRPRQIVTGGLRAYSAATKEVGDADRQEVGRELSKPAEHSYLRSGGEGHAGRTKNEDVPKIQFNSC